MSFDPRLPHETQAQLVDRRREEANERYREHVAAIEAHRTAGTLTPMSYRGDDSPEIQRSERW